jgi:hypothetical protein
MDTAFLYFEVNWIYYGNNNSQEMKEDYDEIRHNKLENYTKFYNGEKNEKS